PSISMILYAMTAQVSAIKLFTAGILPSVLIGIVDAVYVLLYARIKMVPLSSPARWKNIWASTKEASWAIGTIVVIFGGIYGGVFTPTEAAGVAVAVRCHVHLSRGRSRRTVAHHRQLGGADLADPDLRHRCRNLFVVDDDQRHSAKSHQRSQRAPFAELANAVVRQRRVVDRRQFSRTPCCHSHPYPTFASGRRGGRRQCTALRDHHGGESEHRPLHAA